MKNEAYGGKMRYARAQRKDGSPYTVPPLEQRREERRARTKLAKASRKANRRNKS